MYTYSSAHVHFKLNSGSDFFLIKDVKTFETQSMPMNFPLAESGIGYILYVSRGSCELIASARYALAAQESCLFIKTAEAVAAIRSLPHSKVCVIRFSISDAKISELLITSGAYSESPESSITDFIQILLEEYHQQKDNWKQICNFLLGLLCTFFQRSTAQRSRPQPEAGNLSPAEAVKQYIDAHYMEKISIASIAKSLFISESTVSHSFVSLYKTTVAKYILSVRIEESKHYLEQTDLSVEEISEKVGFSSLTTFYRNFSQYTGLSPGEYRNQHQS